MQPRQAATSVASGHVRSLALRRHGPHRCGGIELVGVIEDDRLGGAGGAGVVVGGDGVEDLCQHPGLEPPRALLDQAEAEMDVSNEPTFGGR